MRYNQLLDTLQNLIKRKPSQNELGKILGLAQTSMSGRALRNSNISDEEISLIEGYYNISILNRSPLSDDNCANISVYGNVSASMGYGIQVYDEKQTGVYSISRKLAHDIGISPENSTMIFAKGDSMEPTIVGGDSLLIDKNKTEVYDGSIYCVRIEGQLYAKRLQKIPPSTIAIISDNQKYKTFEIDLKKQIDFDFEIIGEVRWWGRVAR